jgi:hypothetical protein
MVDKEGPDTPTVKQCLVDGLATVDVSCPAIDYEHADELGRIHDAARLEQADFLIPARTYTPPHILTTEMEAFSTNFASPVL